MGIVNTFYWELPVEQVANDFNPVVLEERMDDDGWMLVLVEDKCSGMQFWVDVAPDGRWEFNENIFSLLNDRDCFRMEFYRQENVVLMVDDLVYSLLGCR